MVTAARAMLLRNSSEDDLLAYVKDQLELGHWIWHHAGDSRRSTAGLPDIVAVRPPRVIFAELKSRTGRTRRLQKIFLEALRLCPGVETYIWRPEHMDEIEQVLR